MAKSIPGVDDLCGDGPSARVHRPHEAQKRLNFLRTRFPDFTLDELSKFEVGGARYIKNFMEDLTALDWNAELPSREGLTLHSF